MLPSLFHTPEAGGHTTRKVRVAGNLPAAVDGFFDLCQIGANGPEKALHKAGKSVLGHFSRVYENEPFSVYLRFGA